MDSLGVTEIIRASSIQYTILALLAILILSAIVKLTKNSSEKIKYLIFGLIVVTSLGNTIYLVGSTIYLNQKSVTGGPVHYHGDFEIWNCGMKVEIKDPEGFSNKVGKVDVHEHNDQRIHIEGVILDPSEASLGHFFKALGGSLDEQYLAVPVENGLLTMENGQLCPDGNKARIQVFLFKTEGKTFSQTKLKNPASYIISPYSKVPPGDCVIIEFGLVKERTDKLCNFYKVAKEKGELVER